MRLCLVHEDVDVFVRLYSVVYDNMGTREELKIICVVTAYMMICEGKLLMSCGA